MLSEAFEGWVFGIAFQTPLEMHAFHLRVAGFKSQLDSCFLETVGDGSSPGFLSPTWKSCLKLLALGLHLTLTIVHRLKCAIHAQLVKGMVRELYGF